MALIDCQECGNPKSHTARRCPHCGAKKPYTRWKQNLLAVAILVVILIIVLGWYT